MSVFPTDALDRIELHKKDGSEPFSYDTVNTGHTLFDFWRWAYSDIISNAYRGVLAFILRACYEDP